MKRKTQQEKKQGKVTRLPFFNSFPYLVAQVSRNLHHISLLPSDWSSEELCCAAQEQADANKFDVVLVASDDFCVYFYPDQAPATSNVPPRGGIFVSEKLEVSRPIHQDEEFLKRLEALDHFIESHKRPGFLVGDLTKGGREANPRELDLLAGTSVEGVPLGLEQCPLCGDWKGECLDPSPAYQGLVVQVNCLCENDNLCARCQRSLYPRKLHSNYYNRADGEIWHVPSFCAFGHLCPDQEAEAA